MAFGSDDEPKEGRALINESEGDKLGCAETLGDPDGDIDGPADGIVVGIEDGTLIGLGLPEGVREG